VLVYNFGIQLYLLAIRIAALGGHAKAKKWLQGRAAQLIQLSTRSHHSKSIWMHCASLGEYEQGLPILQALKQANPQFNIVLTFFSPSGYENFKKNDFVDECYYLPADTSSNANRFLKQINPSVAIFVKYEFWPNFLQALRQKEVPTFLVCGMLREHPFTKWYGSVHRSALNCFTHFFVQSQASAAILTQLGFKNFTIAGDTRYQRAWDNANTSFSDERIEHFCKQHHTVLVCGSTWPKDEQLLASLLKLQPQLGLIIAPHHTDDATIKETESLFSNSQRLSDYKEQPSQVLIVNSIGVLRYLYRYGTAAYVGGGFGAGIHNTLEAAAYGKAILCGPLIAKFEEAAALQSMGALTVVSDAKTLNFALQSAHEQAQFLEKELLAHCKQQLGAVEKIAPILANFAVVNR
jgi:3-deoxy-D-manno-octulosonic-acid transferase